MGENKERNEHVAGVHYNNPTGTLIKIPRISRALDTLIVVLTFENIVLNANVMVIKDSEKE